MNMTNEVRELTFRKALQTDIRRQARADGMITLQEDAIRKVFAGLTSIQEILRVTAAQEFYA